MGTVKITVFQMFALLTLFLLGSTVVVGLGLDSEENAWLINLFAMFVGIVLFFFYAFILHKGGWADFGEILEKGFGKAGGKIISLLYSIYFYYIAARIVKDFSYFISQTLFYNIRDWIISAMLLILAAYGCKLGLEALARTAEILMFMTMLLVFSLIALALMSDFFSMENIMPLYNPDEIKWGTLPQLFTFPYGEMVVFLLIFASVNQPEKLIKKGWLAVIAAGIIILILSELIIGIVGAKTAAIYTYPLVKSIEMIEYLEVIQHLEIFSVFSFLFVGFIKIGIFFEAGTMAFANVFRKLKKENIIYPAASLAMLATLYMAENLPQHLFLGLKVVPYLVHLPFQFLIPGILAVLLVLKKERNQAF
ncbi:GerAB/ArcD/ProY family transporter [Bacillus infantis]|uniref:GerAB/ArcD/ProY family transporter n=1 Tax=Bacillus infantis TaxID=324767 RepID=UPI003CF0DE07